MQILLSYLDKFESHIQDADKINPAVSEGSVGWHLEHSCLVIIKITETVSTSNPSNYKWKFSFLKLMVLTLGKFPRGRAKAPKSVIPMGELNANNLSQSIANARLAVASLAACQKNQFFLHPIFGELNTSKTMHFLGIHTKHHLGIIHDILK